MASSKLLRCERQRPTSNNNTRRAPKGIQVGHHLVLLVIFMLLRQAYASNLELKKVEEDGGEDGEEEVEHFQVFHVDFQHVQTYFIVALWLFLASISKVGK